MGKAEEKMKYRMGLILNLIGTTEDITKKVAIAIIHTEWGLTRRFAVEAIGDLMVLKKVLEDDSGVLSLG